MLFCRTKKNLAILTTIICIILAVLLNYTTINIAVNSNVNVLMNKVYDDKASFSFGDLNNWWLIVISFSIISSFGYLFELNDKLLKKEVCLSLNDCVIDFECVNKKNVFNLRDDVVMQLRI